MEYIKRAKNIVKFILNDPDLPEDKIPFWDFDAPGIPYTVRDASAAAIMASVFLELGGYSNDDEKKNYLDVAIKILKLLSGDRYRAKYHENGGFLLKHSTGGYVLNSEINVPANYFLEAMKRYYDWCL